MTATLAGLALAIVVFLLAAYMERRPKADGELRWTPYIGIQMAALLAVIVALAHLVSLLTGTPLVGRYSG